MGDCSFLAGKPSRHATSHTGQLSLAIPPWTGAMITVDGYGHRSYSDENGEFCVALGPATRTAGM